MECSRANLSRMINSARCSGLPHEATRMANRGVAKATREHSIGKRPVSLRCRAVRDRHPARWAWHDHSAASRRAHGAAYATYVGCWRSRFRVTKGQSKITRFQEKATGRTRSLLPMRHAAHLRAAARAADGQHTTRADRRPHGTRAALSHRHRRAAGLTYLGEPLRSAKRLSWRGGSVPTEEAASGHPRTNARISCARRSR